MASLSSLTKGCTQVHWSQRGILIDIKGHWIGPHEGLSLPETSRNNSVWCTWPTAPDQPLGSQALDTANTELTNNSWKCAKKFKEKYVRKLQCVCGYFVSRKIIYLWNKLVPEKRSLSSEQCAVKSANRTQASFLLSREVGKYRDMDEMSLGLLLKCEVPIKSHFNHSYHLKNNFFLLSKCFNLFSHECWQALVWSLSISDTAKLIQSLISFWLDYCNVLPRGSSGRGCHHSCESITCRRKSSVLYSNHIVPFTSYKQKGLTRNGNTCSWNPDQLGNGVTPRAGMSLMWWAIALQRQQDKGRRLKLKPLAHLWFTLDSCVEAAGELSVPPFWAVSGNQKDKFISSLRGFALGDKEWRWDYPCPITQDGGFWWWLKSLQGALQILKIICTRAVHSSTKPCRVRDKGAEGFWLHSSGESPWGFSDRGSDT